MVKVDLITGFLGSGKTTFLQKYARYLMGKGEKIGIIENDYGSVNVDMMLLQDLEREGAVTEMVVGGDLDCYRRRFRTKLITMGMQNLDRVIVEPSGIYDADEFFDALYEDPVCSLCEPGSVIAIVDACMDLPLGPAAEYLLVSQLADAGMVLMSHFREEGKPGDGKEADGLPDSGSTSAGEEKKESGEQKETFGEQEETSGEQEEASGEQEEGSGEEKRDAGEKKAAELLGSINRAMQKLQCGRTFDIRYDRCREGFGADVLAKPWDMLDGQDFERVRSAGYRQFDHIKLPVESRNGFRTLYYMNLGLSRENILRASRSLIGRPGSGTYREEGPAGEHAGIIYRVKGFFQENGQWYELNATRSGTEVRKIGEGQDVLIVIGENVNPDAVDRELGGKHIG